MIHNKTNLIAFLLCILLPTTSYGMKNLTGKNPKYDEILELWKKAEKTYAGIDLLNDILINSLKPTPEEIQKNDGPRTYNRVQAILEIQRSKPMPHFTSDKLTRLANNILSVKKDMTELADNNDINWPTKNAPNDTWNQEIANKAIELGQTHTINTDGMLKIINEIIDKKASDKQLITNGLTGTYHSPLLKTAKENIKEVIEEKIKTAKTKETGEQVEKERIQAEEQAEEQAERERLQAEEQEKTKKEQTEIEEKLKTERKATELVPQKEILEIPLEVQKVTEEKPEQEQQPIVEPVEQEKLEQKNKQVNVEQIIPAQQKTDEEATKVNPQEEAKKVELEKNAAAQQATQELAATATKKAEVIEQKQTIEEVIEDLIKQNEATIKDAYEKNTVQAVADAISPVITAAAETFPSQLTQVKTICTEKLKIYGDQIQNNAGSTTSIINYILRPFLNAAAKKETELAEIERAKAQELLKSRMEEFNRIIEDAKKNTNLDTKEIEAFAKKASQETPLTKEEIDNINNVFDRFKVTLSDALATNAEMVIGKQKSQDLDTKLEKFKSELPRFEDLIKQAKAAPLKTKEIQKYKQMINDSKTNSLNYQKIQEIEAAFAELEKLLQEKKAAQEYPEVIAEEIKKNRDKGLGTVIIYPGSEMLTKYIKDLAKDAGIETIKPDTWYPITFGDEKKGTLNKRDTFWFKQLKDDRGTLIYLKHPDDTDTSTIIASNNLTYIGDYTILPKIAAALTTLKVKHETVGLKEVREALEERIKTAKIKVEQLKQQNVVAEKQVEEIAEYEPKKKKKEEETEQEAAKEIQEIKKRMHITQEQAENVFAQQKNLEKQKDYFIAVLRNAKDENFDDKKIEELEQMIADIKAKKVYEIKINDIEKETKKIIDTFDNVNKELETKRENSKKMTYLERINKDVKDNQIKGIGTVIVHPQHATSLLNYIKGLAKEAGIETIHSGKWYSIDFSKEKFKFKQLRDGGIEYLKSPSEPNTTIIVDSAIIDPLDNSIVRQLEAVIQPNQIVYSLEPLETLKKRIETAKSMPAPTTTEEEKFLVAMPKEKAKDVLNKQKELESQLDYFNNLIREAKKLKLEQQTVQNFTDMITYIKNKKIYLEDTTNIEKKTKDITDAFSRLAIALKEKTGGKTIKTISPQEYLKKITSEIAQKEKEGLGTVIVSPYATDLITYIKTLAKDAGIQMIPDEWSELRFGNEIFKFKQLSDDEDTIEYLKSPDDKDTSTIIADSNWLGNTFDDSIVPEIAKIIKTTKINSNTVEEDLQNRIHKAKELAKSTEAEKKQIATAQKDLVSKSAHFTKLITEAESFKLPAGRVKELEKMVTDIQTKQMSSVEALNTIRETFKGLEDALRTKARPRKAAQEALQAKLNYFTNLIAEAEKFKLDQQQVQDLKKMINYITTEELPSLDSLNSIAATFEQLKEALALEKLQVRKKEQEALNPGLIVVGKVGPTLPKAVEPPILQTTDKSRAPQRIPVAESSTLDAIEELLGQKTAAKQQQNPASSAIRTRLTPTPSTPTPATRRTVTRKAVTPRRATRVK